MVQNLNQFAQTPEQGQLDLQRPGNTITVQVDSSVTTPFIPGQPVRIADSAGGLPKALALTANTQQTAGFVTFNPKDVNFPAGSKFEMTINGSVMWMTANAAIARWATVEVAFANQTVITAAGTNPKIGIALDKATAAGQLIRVLVFAPLAV